MPLYVYFCNDCENEFDEIISLSEDGNKIIECPKCKKTNCRKIFNAVPIKFNSSGFTKRRRG